jgi:hypothetical protein
VIKLPKDLVFVLFCIGRLYILYQRFAAMGRQWHNDVLKSFTRFQDPVPVYPAMPDVLNIIKQNKPVGCLYQLKVADVRIEIGLHDGYLHG